MDLAFFGKFHVFKGEIHPIPKYKAKYLKKCIEFEIIWHFILETQVITNMVSLQETLQELYCHKM